MKLLSIVLRSAKNKLKEFYNFYRIKELIYPTELANIKGKTSDPARHGRSRVQEQDDVAVRIL